MGNELRIRQLAPDYVTVFESPDPEQVYVYSPGLTVLPSGRLVATMDMSGPGIERIPGPKRVIEWGNLWFGKLFTSDDGGATWTHRTDFPFMHARPFVAGGSLYVIGHCNDLVVMRSDDGGETWSEPAFLTSGQVWHQSACNVHYAKGNVYLVMERLTLPGLKELRTHLLAPVLMRASEASDLTRRESWTFASELTYREAATGKGDGCAGLPFFPVKEPGEDKAARRPGVKTMYSIGWLETNVVQFTDERHYFHDPSGRTFHLWMRLNAGGTGYAAIAKAVEQDDGTIVTKTETAPSGQTLLHVPFPGGQMRFHILYDDVTRLYWLLGTQATDSMTRAELLPPERGSNPNNERNRLVLHVSSNCFDWRFVGLVAMTGSHRQSRHYASMAIHGDDLLIVSRSGDERAISSHDGNLLTFHKIQHFRSLVY